MLLHGYGADGSDLIGLGQHWGPLLPDALFIAPNAPTPCAGNPFGFEWFPLQTATALPAVSRGRRQARAGDRSNSSTTSGAQTGIKPDDTFLVGFSQGAMMALHVGLSLPQPLRGIVAFSGAFVAADGFGTRRRQAAGLPGPWRPGRGGRSEPQPAGGDRAARRPAMTSATTSQPASAHGIAPDGLDFATAFIARAKRLKSTLIESPLHSRVTVGIEYGGYD